MGDRIEWTLTLRGMTCGHCVKSVTEALGVVAGVTEVDVTLDPPRAVVRGRNVDPGALLGAVAGAGFTAIREDL